MKIPNEILSKYSPLRPPQLNLLLVHVIGQLHPTGVRLVETNIGYDRVSKSYINFVWL